MRTLYILRSTTFSYVRGWYFNNLALHDLDTSTAYLLFENQRQCLKSASNASRSSRMLCLTSASCRFIALNSCDEVDCPHTNSNGFRGRVCDPSCADGVPFGTNGCGAREGRHGDLCRVCYNDVDRALANDDPVDRAIMYVMQLLRLILPLRCSCSTHALARLFCHCGISE